MRLLPSVRQDWVCYSTWINDPDINEPDINDRGDDTDPPALAQWLVSRKILAAEQLLALEERQRAALAAGDTPPPLSQLLLTERIITGSQLATLLRELYSDTPTLLEDHSSDLFEYRHALPHQIGRYEVIREIGRGGMAVVYEAIDPKLNQHVALKVLHSDCSTGDTLIRLQREARLAAGLTHPLIIPVREIGEATQPDGNSLHYIAMDYIPGKTLENEKRRLSRNELIDLWLQVVEAVTFAHSQGVIHRDLKPDNILVTEGQRPVVTDFGLARAADSTQLTHSGVVMGTVSYMSPEQVLGRFKQCDERTDVWALGVMLYEILAQRLPFDGETYALVLDAIVEKSPAPPPGPEDLARICLTALTKRVDQRYADAGEMLADLRAWRSGAPPIARRSSSASLMRPTLTLLGIVLFGLGAWGYWHAHRPVVTAVVGTSPSLSETSNDTRGNSAELAQRRLGQRLKAVSQAVSELRAAHYQVRADIAAKRQAVKAALAELSRVNPEGAESENVNLLISRGQASFWMGEIQQAEKHLLQVEKLQPHDGWVALYLGRIYLQKALDNHITHPLALEADRHAQAEWARKALAYLRRPTDGWVGARPIDRAVVKAYVLFLRKQPRQLEAHCDQAALTFRDQVGLEEIWAIRGCLDHADNGVIWFSRALKLRPHYALARLWRAYCYKEQGANQRAIADCTAALKLRPTLLQALFTRALCLSRLGQREKALADYDRMVSLSPGSAFPLHNRAAIKFELGREAEAIEDLGRAIKFTTSSKSYCERSRLYLKMGKPELALADANSAIRLAPRRPSGYYNRARVHKNQDRLKAALADYDRALERKPKFWQALFGQGLVYSAMGRPRQTIRAYSATLRINPRFELALLNRGKQRIKLKQLKAAASDFTKALQLNPELVDGWIDRAYCRLKLGQPKPAIRDYQEALKLSADKAGIYARIGFAHIIMRDWTCALRNLDRAIQLDPRAHQAHFNRGALHLTQGRFAKAASDLAIASRLEPRSWMTWHHYGVALLNSNRRQEAITALRTARKLAPRSAWPEVDATLKMARDGK